jgi:tetratricopeptide (TPR) repeat protein
MKKHTPYFTLLLVLIAFASAQAQMPALQKAREHWLGNNDEKALLLYQQVIKEYPTNSPALLEAYYKSGVIYASKKENKKAVIFFQKMIQLKPNKQEKESVLLRSFMQAAANPYQQYMHLAYEYLANIALQQKNTPKHSLIIRWQKKSILLTTKTPILLACILPKTTPIVMQVCAKPIVYYIGWCLLS